jgi:hypothetical protein
MSGDPRDEFDIGAEELRKQWGNCGEDGSTGAKANGRDEWPEPEPLTAPREAERPYPVDALPWRMGDAVLEYAEYGQQPISLIASSGMSSVSLVSQGLADVARDERLRGPLSLYELTVGVSGERKTSADNVFKTPLRRWMIERGDAMQDEVRAATAKQAAWKAQYDGLISQIKAVSTGRRTDLALDDLRTDLIELQLAKPDEVIVPRLFYEDVNNPALAESLGKGWPSASLWSDEGGLVIGSHGMSDDWAMGFIGMLNRFWDGNAFDRDRVGTGSTRIRGRRFTVSLMAQPIAMERLLTLADGASRAMGLLARFLISWPASTIGTRMYREPPKDMPAVARLCQRLWELLDTPLPIEPMNPAALILSPPKLSLTPRAWRLWRQFHDDIEAEIGKNGEYADVADIGAKVAENAARIAGNFHVLEHGPVGEIDSKTFYRAAKIAEWHLYEARRVLAAFDQPKHVSDAELLLAWLLQRPEKAAPEIADPRDIQRGGPSPLRDLKRRDEALDTLVRHKYLFAVAAGILGRGAKRYFLNPRARMLA